MIDLKYTSQSGENFAEIIIEFPLLDGQPIVQPLCYDDKTITTLENYKVLIKTKKDIVNITTDEDGNHTIVLNKDLVLLLARAYKFLISNTSCPNYDLLREKIITDVKNIN